jgi:hypothetical protein
MELDQLRNLEGYGERGWYFLDFFVVLWGRFPTKPQSKQSLFLHSNLFVVFGGEISHKATNAFPSSALCRLCRRDFPPRHKEHKDFSFIRNLFVVFVGFFSHQDTKNTKPFPAVGCKHLKRKSLQNVEFAGFFYQ